MLTFFQQYERSMKKISIFLLTLCASFSAFAEDVASEVIVKNSGIWYSVQGMSPSGRYVCGSSMYNGAYRWDTEEGQLLWVSVTSSTSEMAFRDVSETGVMVGQDDGQRPAYYENGEWHPLSTHSGVAARITGDASIICGDEYYPATMGKPYDVRPTVWYRQADGTYQKEPLPNPQTDWIGGPTQFNTARAVTDDGRFVVGVQVEDRGRYYSCIVWEKQADGTWNYTMPFAELEFNVEAFKAIQDEEPQLSDYVFVATGQPGYFNQVENFQRAHAAWQYKLNTNGRTGYFYAVPPVILSENGYTLALPRQKTEWSYSDGDIEVAHNSVVHPVTYNLETKEFVEHLDAVGVIPYSVTQAGDMLSSDGYDAFIMPCNSTKKELLQDWLLANYNFDLWDVLPPNTGYVTDQGISADGKKIFIMYTSVTLEGELDNMEVVSIKLPGSSDGIVEVEKSQVDKTLWHDLYGRRINMESSSSASHIYINNGKKMLK